MLAHIPFPALPVPPSWFPGHMLQFQKMLPTLLNKTDVVLELRDSRLPLTSINRNFEGVYAALHLPLFHFVLRFGKLWCTGAARYVWGNRGSGREAAATGGDCCGEAGCVSLAVARGT